MNCLLSCKDNSEVEKADSLAIDSVSFSAMRVSCHSPSSGTIGIAVIDVKKLYLEGKEIETHTGGQLFETETTDEESLLAIIEQVAESLTNNSYRSGGFDSFYHIFSSE